MNHADLTLRLVGIAAGVKGVMLLWAAVRWAMMLFDDRAPDGVPIWMSLSFGLQMVVWFGGIGAFCLWVAYATWRPLRQAAVTQATAFVCMCIWLQVQVALNWIPESWIALSETSRHSLESLAGLLVAGAAFVAVRWDLLKYSSAPEEPTWPGMKAIYVVYCLMLWTDMGMLADDAVPTTAREPLNHGLVTLILPMALAFAVYSLMVYVTFGIADVPIIGPRVAAANKAKAEALARERIARFECPDCGYNVRQSLIDERETCPECGFEIAGVSYPGPQPTGSIKTP